MAESLRAWDYRIESELLVETLDELGRQGWELIETGENRYVFKRPALTFVERVTLEQRARYYASLGLDPDATR
jgi:hypothetical protein